MTGRTDGNGRLGRRLVWFGLLYTLGLAVFGAVGLGLPRAIALLGGPARRMPPTAPARPAAQRTAPAADAARARFDIVQIAPDGRAVIAGHAPPGSTVAVTVNGRLIGRARADGSGSWLLLPQQALRQGQIGLTVQIVAGRRQPDGRRLAATPAPLP